jgi:hypothetical protein
VRDAAVSVARKSIVSQAKDKLAAKSFEAAATIREAWMEKGVRVASGGDLIKGDQYCADRAASRADRTIPGRGGRPVSIHSAEFILPAALGIRLCRSATNLSKQARSARE